MIWICDLFSDTPRLYNIGLKPDKKSKWKKLKPEIIKIAAKSLMIICEKCDKKSKNEQEWNDYNSG